MESKIKLLDGMHADACALRKAVLDPFKAVEAKAEELMRSYLIQKKLEEEAERRRQQEIADKAAVEEKELLRLQAEMEGNFQEAEILASLPPATVMVKVASAVPQQDGMSTRRKFKWRVKNLEEIPRTYMIPNEKMLNEVAKSTTKTKDGRIFYAIPVPAGIEIYEDVIFSG